MKRIDYLMQFILAIVLIILTSACNDPDDIGINLQPEGDQPSVSITDTFTLKSFIVPEDSLVMWSTTKNALESPTLFLGSLNDPYVGQTYATTVSQIVLGNTISSTTFNGITSVDSVVLSFGYKSLFGDTAAEHHISIYELTETLYTDSIYYSSRSYSKGNLIGSAIIVPDTDDSVTVAGVKKAPQLRIALDTAFGGKLVREYIANPSTFSSKTTFLNYFKGILIVDSVNGTGSMVTLQSNSILNVLTLYYGSTLSYDFRINNDAVRMSSFKHNYLASNTDNIADDQLVIQSMAGLKDSIAIPTLSSLYNNGKISINSAKLVFQLQPGSVTSGFAQHNNLLILASDSVGKNAQIIDAVESSSYYGGAFNSTDQTYTFNIARHVQRTVKNLVENNGKDYGLFLVAGGSTSNGQRTVVKGNSAIKLIVTYTQVNP